MARSHAIWVVNVNRRPVAAFTVKHELITWLSHQLPENLQFFRLFRCPDKPSWHPDYYEPPVEIPISEVLGEN